MGFVLDQLFHQQQMLPIKGEIHWVWMIKCINEIIKLKALYIT